MIRLYAHQCWYFLLDCAPLCLLSRIQFVRACCVSVSMGGGVVAFRDIAQSVSDKRLLSFPHGFHTRRCGWDVGNWSGAGISLRISLALPLRFQELQITTGCKYCIKYEATSRSEGILTFCLIWVSISNCTGMTWRLRTNLPPSMSTSVQESLRCVSIHLSDEGHIRLHACTSAYPRLDLPQA